MGTSLRPLTRRFVLLLVIFMSVPVFGQWTPGDANDDGYVDLMDFAALKVHFGVLEGATVAEGDFDGDGDVDLDDFVILKDNFGTVPPPQELTLDLGGDITMDLVRIPAGTFMMGSPLTELDRDADEGQVHEVTLSQDFYMGIYEVTQEQYQAVTGADPSYFTSSGLTAPVEKVSWYDAVVFCDQLSLLAGRTVALPTEAQWEYACRAGSTTRFYYGDDLDYSLLGAYAWYSSNSGDQTHPVGEKAPNLWGLYDMHGNVWEWCSDWYDGNYYQYANNTDPQGPQITNRRVMRGGSWTPSPGPCRSANRNRNYPDNRHYFLGFRVVVVVGVD